MYIHLHERVMCQLMFLHIIRRPPYVSAPSIVCHRDFDAILNDFYSHLVLDEAHNVLVGEPWAYAHGYIQWFYRVSHPYMTQDVAGAPPRLAHQEILEDERTKDDHTTNLSSVYQRIMTIARGAIESEDIAKDNPDMAASHTILLEARSAFGYR